MTTAGLWFRTGARLVARARWVMRARVGSPVRAGFLRLNGIELGKNVRVLGRPLVTLTPGSRISIGMGTTLVSVSAPTALGVARPVILRTLARDAHISIGDDCGLSGTTVCAASSITIEDRVLFGADVMIVDTDFHPIDALPRRHAPLPASGPEDAVVIRSDAFVGARTIILRGVEIGSGSVIGAGSVVTKSVPESVVAAGNPCHVLRPLRHGTSEERDAGRRREPDVRSQPDSRP